jgi:group II intron reverse transcriptase/maturase
MVEPLPIKHHSLTGRITFGLLLESFQAVARNKGAAGVDGISVQLFRSNLLDNLSSLKNELKRGSFQPMPSRRVLIPKGNDQFRPLGIPRVRDRVAQEVLRRLLQPLFEPLFHPDSYGFRPGRSAHMALRRVLELKRRRYRQVLDADISGFFDTLPHAVIMRGLTNVVADGTILSLIEKFLKAGVMEEGVFQPTTVGTPQGGVVSPLLANIALNFLDWHLEARRYRFVRYADDFVVLCKSTQQAEEARSEVESFLREELGLTLSSAKTKVTTFQGGFAFLGFELGSHRCRMRAKSVENFKKKLQENTIRSRNLDSQVVRRCNQVVRGFANYFRTEFSTCWNQFRTLDRWYRMRLRCMKYKRKSGQDNWRLRIVRLRRMGMVFLSDSYQYPLRC